ncbi:MAG TPA: response regulator transcription factor [Chitinophagales bacterium]|nr:response regulator transcription factor [Chitinophagales bacterium]
MKAINDFSPLLHVLFLEDLEDDVALMKHELDKEGLKYTSKHVTTKKDFLDALEAFKPDIIIADYSLPMFNGMHAFKLFKEKNIVIPFILATGSLTEELALECMTEGVDDFLLKSQFNRLPTIINRSLSLKEKEKENQQLLSELRKTEADASNAKVHALLSNREFEILCLIASGMAVKEIAEQLFLSPATVATYRARILEKLELESNVQLTRYAIKHKLID